MPDDTEWAAIIEIGRKKPFYFPELGLAVTCQAISPHPEFGERVRVVLRKMAKGEFAPKPRKGLTSRRRRD